LRVGARFRPTDTPKIDVTVSHASGVRSNARIAVHRSRRPVEALRLDGIPVTTAGDRERDALLTSLGWRVMRFTRRQVRRDEAVVAARVLSARSPSLATP